MSNSIENTLVLCDLDNLLLNAEGSLPQLHRDVLQLFASRGGKLTIYSQRSPKVVRSLLGGVRLSAPALVCGGVLAYNFAEGTGTALCSFAGMEESVLRVLPGVPGVGIALQMKNGSTRVLRLAIVGYLLLFVTLALMRMRNLILMMEKRRPWVSELILKRGRQ